MGHRIRAPLLALVVLAAASCGADQGLAGEFTYFDDAEQITERIPLECTSWQAHAVEGDTTAFACLSDRDDTLAAVFYTDVEIAREYDPATQVDNWKADLANSSDCSPVGGGPFLFGGNWFMVITGGNRWPADMDWRRALLNEISDSAGGVLVPGVVCGSAFRPPPDLPQGAIESSSVLAADEAPGLRVVINRRGKQQGRVIDVGVGPPAMLAIWAYRIWAIGDTSLLALVGETPFDDYPRTPPGELQAWLISTDTIEGYEHSATGVVESSQPLPALGDRTFMLPHCSLDGEPPSRAAALVRFEGAALEVERAWRIDTEPAGFEEVGTEAVGCPAAEVLGRLYR